MQLLELYYAIYCGCGSDDVIIFVHSRARARRSAAGAVRGRIAPRSMEAQPAAAAARVTAADISYSEDLVDLFVKLQQLGQGRNKGSVAAKRNIFGQFRARLGPEPDEELCFSVYRLILPELDKVRRAARRLQLVRRAQLTSPSCCRPGAAGVQAEGAGAGGGDCSLAEHRKGESGGNSRAPPSLTASPLPLQSSPQYDQLVHWRSKQSGDFSKNVSLVRGRCPRAASHRPSHASRPQVIEKLYGKTRKNKVNVQQVCTRRAQAARESGSPPPS